MARMNARPFKAPGLKPQRFEEEGTARLKSCPFTNGEGKSFGSTSLRVGRTWREQERRWPCPGSFKRSDRSLGSQARGRLFGRNFGFGRAQFRARKAPRPTGSF